MTKQRSNTKSTNSSQATPGTKKKALPQDDDEAHLSDEALIQAHLKRQPWAFEALFKRHRARVGRLLFSVLKDAGHTEDAAQEVFLQVHRHVKNFKGNAAFTSWLYRVTMNEAFKTLKRQRKWRHTTNDEHLLEATSLVVTEGAGQTPERFLLAGQEKALLYQAMQTLSPKHRFTLTQYYLEDMSIQDIARMTDTPLGSVKSRLYYARAALKNALAPILQKNEASQSPHKMARKPHV